MHLTRPPGRGVLDFLAALPFPPRVTQDIYDPVLSLAS